MHLTKSYSVILAVASIALFFGVATLWFRQRTSLPTVSIDESTHRLVESASHDAPSTSIAPVVALNEFHRSEVKNGRKLWEVKASRGEYNPETANIRLSEATVWIFRKDGEMIELQADTAGLHLDGQSLSHVELEGRVKVVRNNEVTVETDRATFERQSNLVRAPGRVELTSETLQVSGVGLEANVETKEIKLLSHVTSVVKPKSQSSKKGK